MDERVKQAYESVQISEKAKTRIFHEIIASDKKEVKRRIFSKVAIFVMCVLACSSTIYAAHRLLRAGAIASMFGEEKLAKRFEAMSDEIVTAENDIYRAYFLGAVSGEKLCENEIDVENTKSYFVVALERKDGENLTYEDEIIVSPFVQGIAPWQFNIYNMEGSATRQVVDGVLYCLYACSDLEVFANTGVYIGVTDEDVFADAYVYDSESGIISLNEEYDGLNFLFELSTKASNEDVEEDTLSRQNDFMENGRQAINNLDEMMANSMLDEDSVMELQENEEGFLIYNYDDIVDLHISAKAVQKHGRDSFSFMDAETNTKIVKFLVVEYVEGKYVAKLYICE
ncbi:MAG: hypothetical protein IJP29_06275 [Lachnospiraceae bacterium]|nr:hypothetical protein [Lachnospiraceae bacterium]